MIERIERTLWKVGNPAGRERASNNIVTIPAVLRLASKPISDGGEAAASISGPPSDSSVSQPSKQ